MTRSCHNSRNISKSEKNEKYPQGKACNLMSDILVGV